MQVSALRFVTYRLVFRETRVSHRQSSHPYFPLGRAHFTIHTHARPPPLKTGFRASRWYRSEAPAHTDGTSTAIPTERESAMGDADSTSTASSNQKRRAPAYYAVKVGHKPDIYYSWDDAKQQTIGFKGSMFKKFTSLAEAEEFMRGDSVATPKPGKMKYYGVQAGHVPGVYTDYKSTLEQVTGFKGGKQKSFATWEEALAYVNEGKGATPSDGSIPISLKGHLDLATPSGEDSRKASKKLKKNDGSAAIVDINGDFEPGTGPLLPNAEDGFDARIWMPAGRPDGELRWKTDTEQNARKLQPTGDFEGFLRIWTDGAAKGNGQIGAFAGIGVWFGPHDPRNLAEPLTEGKPTNQRAELTAISRAMDIAPIDRNIIIYTDSYYSIKCLTEWFQKWEKNEWKNTAGKPVENKDLIEPIIARIRERELSKAVTKFEWVKGHDRNTGNIAADKLATEGARKANSIQREQKSNQALDYQLIEEGADISRESINGADEYDLEAAYQLASEGMNLG